MAGSSYWDIIAGAIAQWALNKYGGTGAGGTPNQYPTQLPPEMKRVFDEAWNVYKQGGSPAERDVRSAGTQFLGGMPTTAPNFSFVSPALRNSGATFAGGVQVPKIDISKFSGGGSGADANSAPTGSGPFGGSGTMTPGRDTHPETAFTAGRNGPRNQAGGSGDTSGEQSLYDYMGGNPGTPDDINRRMGTSTDPSHGYSTGVDSATFGKVVELFNKWRTDHPNWAQLGPKAALGFITGGVPGLAIGAAEGIIRHMFTSGAPSTTQPPTTAPPVGGRL